MLTKHLYLCAQCFFIIIIISLSDFDILNEWFIVMTKWEYFWLENICKGNFFCLHVLKNI